MAEINTILGNLIFWILRAIVLIYVLSCLYLYFFQNRLIYFPSNVPMIVGEVINLNTDKKINVLLANKGKAKAIIYFGGNAENINHTMSEYLEEFPEYTIYMMNYRGFNGSEGTANEKDLIADAKALYDLIKTKYLEINVIGRSLGSGVAVALAAQKPVKKLVLITPFASILSIAETKFPIFPVRYMLKDKFESYKYAADVKAKILILIAQNDELIPPANSEILANSFVWNTVNIERIADEDHNSISKNKNFYPIINSFMK